MCSIAPFSIGICAEASQIPRIRSILAQRRNRIRDLYARSSALERFGMEVNMIRLLTDSMLKFLTAQPAAFANMEGSEKYPDIRGLVTFYPFENGTVVLADICGLPQGEEPCEIGFFGFHIHEGAACTGSAEDPFSGAGGHYNPASCPHPAHAGDMPVLEAAGGKAWMAFYTERFQPQEVRGRTVILHSMPDDYRSQPAGDAGERIACGVIR